MRLHLTPTRRFYLIILHRPANQDAIFITMMVKAPVIQIISILLGLVIVAFEYPAPFLKGTAAHRNLITRVVMLVFQIFFAIMFYQVRFLLSIQKPVNNGEHRFVHRGPMEPYGRSLLSLVTVVL